MPDWHRAFDEPLTLPGGTTLRTLAEAGHHIQALPKAVAGSGNEFAIVTLAFGRDHDQHSR